MQIKPYSIKSAKYCSSDIITLATSVIILLICDSEKFFWFIYDAASSAYFSLKYKY